MRIAVSQTPSNTPSNTPSYTPTSTECPIGCFDVLAMCCDVRSMYINPTFGYVFIGGDIDNYGGYPIDTVIKLNKNGSLNTSFEYTGTPYYTECVIEQNDGKVLTSGLGTRLLRRLTSTGAIDGTFTELTTSGPSTGVAYSFDIQSDGKVVVGGAFTTVSGNSYNRICRVNSGGTLDTSFNIGTGFNNQVLEVKIQPDGKILAVGNFTQYSGTSVQGLVRLNSDGTLDTTFTAATGSGGNSFLLLPDGKIIVETFSAALPPTQRRRIVRLNSNGTLDGTFAFLYLDQNEYCEAFEYETATGKVFAGGAFQTINGLPQKGLVKINTDGTVDTSFNIGTGFNTEIPTYGPRVIKRKYNGNLYVGGFFTSYDGNSIRALVELMPTGQLFECEVGNCYIFSLSKPTSGFEGYATIRDCNGNLQNIVVRTTEPQYFCANKVFLYNGTLSGGTDIATECCFCFYNPGPTTQINYSDCFGNGKNMVFSAGTIISARFITTIVGPSIIEQLYPCPIVTPTPTMTPSITPTRTPTQTQTPSQTGTIGLTPTTTRTPTLTPTNTQTRTPNITPSMTATNTPTGTPPVVCNTNWTIRNADCGLGTVNDIGINGSFMGTLSGPSTFPLTSTLYGTKANPNGVICGGSNTIQANVTTNIAGTGNCAFMEIIINGVSQHILYFTTNPFPQISGVVINNGDSVEVRIGCFLGPCPSQPAVTSTPTMTPTVTPSSSVLCIDINTNNSLDIVINQVIVNGLIAYTTGGVMPNVPGNGTNLAVVLPAGTYTVDIAYTCSITGQRIEMTSPLTGYYCQNTSTGSNLMTFTGVGFSTLNCLQIFPQDGTC